jgi:hypothetical protein
MQIGKLLRSGFVVGLGVFLCGTALADNCTGYDALVTTYTETRDLGNGMKLTTYQMESIIFTSDATIYNLTTGQCSGTTLATPDGKARTNGHCARHDKDGDTYSIKWSQEPGADKGMWESTGGTGKFAGKTNSGWAQTVRSDGKMAAVQWGGNCK